jgi:hypothetical protein
MSSVADRRQQLRAVPWGLVRRGLRLARRLHWSQPRPTGTYLHTTASLEAITATLGDRYWYPNWELSAHYEGEDLNLSRTRRDPHAGVEWWQEHCRGWREDGGVSLKAHYEPDPSEHPVAHLTPTYHDRETGMARLRETLDDAGIEYATFEYG